MQASPLLLEQAPHYWNKPPNYWDKSLIIGTSTSLLEPSLLEQAPDLLEPLIIGTSTSFIGPLIIGTAQQQSKWQIVDTWHRILNLWGLFQHCFLHAIIIIALTCFLVNTKVLHACTVQGAGG